MPRLPNGFSCALPPQLKAGEQFQFGSLHRFRRRAVGLGARLPLQILPRQIPPEIAGQAWQLPQDLPRGGIPAVHALAFPLPINHQLGQAAGPMKIQVSIEVVLIEGLDGGRLFSRWATV